MNDYVVRIGKLKLSNSKLSDFLYAYVMCNCKDLKTFSGNLKQYTKRQNVTHYIDFGFSIKEEQIPKFIEMTGLELKESIEIHLN